MRNGSSRKKRQPRQQSWAKLFRDTADTAEKLADCMEDPESTEEQQEAALKEFTWAVMKLQLGGAAIG